MKIFLGEKNCQMIEINDTKTHIEKNVKNITVIYCLDGIYELHNNKVKQIEIKDMPSRKEMYNNVNIIIDNSEFKKTANVCSIESLHHIVNVERIEYTLRRGAKITLVVEKVKSKIKQLYFETNENIYGYAITEDFVTLLSLIS